MRAWLKRRRASRNRSPWEAEELSRLKVEVQASLRRRLRARRQQRRLLRGLPW